ncbi:trypsin-like serine peptidase [Mangrovicoccus algicola]|uniref:Trypsin-like serine protease n=1 Tax=Mangrovicoccus algicola TaxID=2771008 RepID=A0A8J6ZFV5_9RHOB|nr:trypsin-like serine protease [Mangrovicoccus algicola]MBE3640490.1 trypsin-like serine protease [Mangrovicoccus algicola]
MPHQLRSGRGRPFGFPGRALWRRRLGLASCLLLALGSTPQAQDRAAIGALPQGSAREVLDAVQQAQLGAIGRLAASPGGAHCTATLIAPDLVLTAAHCLSAPAKGWVAPAYRVQFRPGYREGHSPAVLSGAALVLGQDYERTAMLSEDLALLRLKTPVPQDLIQPIPVGTEPLLRGRDLSIYSYGYDVAEVLSRETGCRALAALHGAMVTTCEAVGGVSGAPVIALDGAGRPRVAGIVSSRLKRQGETAPFGRAVVVPVDAARISVLAHRLVPSTMVARGNGPLYPAGGSGDGG